VRGRLRACRHGGAGFRRTFRYLPRPSPTLKVISTPDASLGAGWNAALRECEGAYLMVANGGDAIINVKPLVEALDRDPNLDFAYGDIRIETVSNAVVPVR